MPRLLLTKSSTFILGPVAVALGVIMNAIYSVMYGAFKIENIALTIILFTFFVYMLMTPLTIKQQRFSKMSAVMNPELEKIKKKYEGKKDNASMMKMNEETKAVYEKYGVSATGSCLQLIIQMPILFALYRVIMNIPAYVDHIRGAFTDLVNVILNNTEAVAYVQEIGTKNGVNLDYSQSNTIIDALDKFNQDAWQQFGQKFANVPELSSLITKTESDINRMNNFFGINIANSPWTTFQKGIAAGSVLVIIVAILIPLLAAVTQFINTRMIPQQKSSGEAGTMESTMKSMNMIMPIFSAVMCVSMPAGLGIYWIAGSVIRSIQQFSINKYMDKLDIDDMVKKNMDKANKKREKKGLPPQKISNMAKQNVKAIEEPKQKVVSEEEKRRSIEDSTQYYKSDAKPGSIAAKANMVQKYNERNKK